MKRQPLHAGAPQHYAASERPPFDAPPGVNRQGGLAVSQQTVAPVGSAAMDFVQVNSPRVVVLVQGERDLKTASGGQRLDLSDGRDLIPVENPVEVVA